MIAAPSNALAGEVRDLAREKRATILAHNYQPPEVQDVADVVGDSLELARCAAESDARVIVLAGVRFMAESAKILAPEKTVLLPCENAGCPMADMLTVEALAAWKAEYPGVPVVTYVNSSAQVKALSDVCCTSANAVEVTRSLGAERVLFGPDRNLGAWVAAQLPETKVLLWEGCCPVHDSVTRQMVDSVKQEHPAADVFAHPECRAEVLACADSVCSTSQMLRYARAKKEGELIVVTESGLMHGLAKAAPHVRVVTVQPPMVCPDMKRTSLAMIRDALSTGRGEVTVPADVAAAARQALERMTAIGQRQVL